MPLSRAEGLVDVKSSKDLPQARHASAAYLIPTCDPIVGFVTPSPCTTTSPTPSWPPTCPVVFYQNMVYFSRDTDTMTFWDDYGRLPRVRAEPVIRMADTRVRSMLGQIRVLTHRTPGSPPLRCLQANQYLSRTWAWDW